MPGIIIDLIWLGILAAALGTVFYTVRRARLWIIDTNAVRYADAIRSEEYQNLGARPRLTEGQNPACHGHLNQVLITNAVNHSRVCQAQPELTLKERVDADFQRLTRNYSAKQRARFEKTYQDRLISAAARERWVLQIEDFTEQARDAEQRYLETIRDLRS